MTHPLKPLVAVGQASLVGGGWYRGGANGNHGRADSFFAVTGECRHKRRSSVVQKFREAPTGIGAFFVAIYCWC